MRLPHAFNQLRARLQNGPLKSGSFVRNVLTIFAGTALSQAIAIAVLPVLTRIFAPAQLGVLATFVAFTTIFAIAASLSYQAAIILPKRDESAFVLYIGCLLINLIVSSITGFILIILAADIGRWLNYPDVESWIWFVPIGIVMQGCIISTSLWFTRLKQFSDISKGMVTERLTTAASQLGISIVSVSASGLIVGQVLGSVAGFLFLDTLLRLKAFLSITGDKSACDVC